MNQIRETLRKYLPLFALSLLLSIVACETPTENNGGHEDDQYEGDGGRRRDPT